MLRITNGSINTNWKIAQHLVKFSAPLRRMHTCWRNPLESTANQVVVFKLKGYSKASGKWPTSVATKPHHQSIQIVKQLQNQVHYGIILAEDSDVVAIWTNKSDSVDTRQALLLLVVDGQDNGEGHVGEGAVSQAKAVEMQRLQILVLTHKASERRGPSLRDSVHPLQVHQVELNFGQCRGLGLFALFLLLWDMQVDQDATIGLNESTSTRSGGHGGCGCSSGRIGSERGRGGAHASLRFRCQRQNEKGGGESGNRTQLLAAWNSSHLCGYCDRRGGSGQRRRCCLHHNKSLTPHPQIQSINPHNHHLQTVPWPTITPHQSVSKRYHKNCPATTTNQSAQHAP